MTAGGTTSGRLNEKRSASRSQKRLTVKFGTRTADKTGFTRNISDTGMFLQTGSILKPGTTIQVQLELLNQKFGMWARVVWAKKVPPQLAQILGSGMGICFVDPPPEWLKAYERWAKNRRGA